MQFDREKKTLMGGAGRTRQFRDTGDWTSPLAIRFGSCRRSRGDLPPQTPLAVISAGSDLTDEWAVGDGPFKPSAMGVAP
jgi:hypothetical protein